MAEDRIAQLERDNARLRHAVSMLHRVAALVQRSLELEATCYGILTGVTAGVGLGLNRAMLFLVDGDDRQLLRGVAAVGPDDAVDADRVWRSIEADRADLDTLYDAGLVQRRRPGALDRRVRQLRLEVTGDTPVAHALRNAHEPAPRDHGSDHLGGLFHLDTCVVAPLRGRHGVVGVLYADNCFSGRPLDAMVEQVFTLVADHAAAAIEAAREYERVARAARTDALTGLGHHGAMMTAVNERVASAHAEQSALAVALIDLDDFKAVNDTHGHLVGDALLVGVASRLRDALRRDGEAYRYGGEEFAAVLPGVEGDQLVRVGERLRNAVGERPYAIGERTLLHVTCSVGIAPLHPGDGGGDLIGNADAALLRAKRLGKNRVVSG